MDICSRSISKISSHLWRHVNSNPSGSRPAVPDIICIEGFLPKFIDMIEDYVLAIEYDFRILRPN
ncbi:MAG: hypothetical protein CML73_02485 [Rhodobiaceae bacterium]|nr:hypothetical protein [Rhodobiaceae bacterium]